MDTRVFVEPTERRCRTVGRSADVLYVQFHAHVISDVKTKISGRRRKRYFTATEMVVGLQTEKYLEDEAGGGPLFDHC